MNSTREITQALPWFVVVAQRLFVSCRFHACRRFQAMQHKAAVIFILFVAKGKVIAWSPVFIGTSSIFYRFSEVLLLPKFTAKLL